MAKKAWRMNFTAASSAIGDLPIGKSMEMLVGLARIELATSSLSGMRSNRLSYSPLTGLRTLSVALASLNRPSDHFFFQHRDPDTADQFSN